jgi:hypothetical protein
VSPNRRLSACKGPSSFAPAAEDEDATVARRRAARTAARTAGEDQSLGYDIGEEPGECPCGSDRHVNLHFNERICAHMGSAGTFVQGSARKSDQDVDSFIA